MEKTGNILFKTDSLSESLWIVSWPTHTMSVHIGWFFLLIKFIFGSLMICNLWLRRKINYFARVCLLLSCSVGPECLLWCFHHQSGNSQNSFRVQISNDLAHKHQDNSCLSHCTITLSHKMFMSISKEVIVDLKTGQREICCHVQQFFRGTLFKAKLLNSLHFTLNT